MKSTKTRSILIVLFTFLIFSASGQKTSTNTMAVEMSEIIIMKWSKDIQLTDVQKNTIKAKFKVVDAKFKKVGTELTATEDSIYRKEIRIYLEDIRSNVLTVDQRRIMKDRGEARKPAPMKKVQAKN